MLVRLRPPDTSTGTLLLAIPPFPSCPSRPAPQQYGVPELVSPQTLTSPLLRAENWSPPATGVGVKIPLFDGSDEPFPNCPKELLPQQYAEPPVAMPQVSPEPGLM